MIGGMTGWAGVVTGGASGIGKACVDLLGECGVTVYVADLAGQPAVDVTERAALDGLAARIAERHEGIHVLVNAAGILTTNAPVDELPADDFRRNYEVNVLGTLNACQALGPLLRQVKGAVVNIASQAALVSLPMQAAYTTAKAGVAALTRSLAIDWADAGVRVNCVCPGFTRTPMSAAFFENPTFTAAATRRIPLGRILEPHEIAGAIAFLASPLAAAITGVVLPVDGGWTAGEPALPW
jgi:meso-butanediol dehydrogenase/(S,S)-butanediol dehydrogenase/diacetyl reductase